MKIEVFGRSGCARTREVLVRLARWVRTMKWSSEVQLQFFDLETAEGLAEAAFRQLEGEIPAVFVSVATPGPVISGEPPFPGREWGQAAARGAAPIWN